MHFAIYPNVRNSTKSVLAPKKDASKRIAFRSTMHFSMEKLLSLLHPLKRFQLVIFRALDPIGSFRHITFKGNEKKWNKEREREEGEEEEEEMHILILFYAMKERRRKIVLLTLLVEDNFQDTKQPQSSFYGSNINAKFSRLDVENGKENRDWGVRDLHSFARFYRPLCLVFQDCPVASVNKDVQYGKFPAR